MVIRLDRLALRMSPAEQNILPLVAGKDVFVVKGFSMGLLSAVQGVC